MSIFFMEGGGGGMWKDLSLPPDETMHPASPMILLLLIPSYHWNSINVYFNWEGDVGIYNIYHGKFPQMKP